MTLLLTPRLRLEPLTDAHFDGLHALNSDPAVMRYITGKPDTPDDTRVMIEQVKARWADWGYSWWAFIELSSGALIGAGCVQHLGRDPANPHEIGWRLQQDRWGKGLASEAAHAMAAHAFGALQAPLLCAVCDPENTDSARVMTRLGMVYKALEHWYGFDCAVYQMTREDWLDRTAAG